MQRAEHRQVVPGLAEHGLHRHQSEYIAGPFHPTAYLGEQLNAYAELGTAYISIVAGYDERSSAETIDALGIAVQSLAS